jgi:hypothetical protein
MSLWPHGAHPRNGAMSILVQVVDEDKPLRIDAFLMLYPLRSPSRNVGTILFASHHACF